MIELPEPDKPPGYYCNKCGYVGTSGPVHRVAWGINSDARCCEYSATKYHDGSYTAATVRRLLEQAHEERRAAQAECERLKEERARIGIEHRRLIAEAVEKEREAQRTRRNLTLASPEMASAMKQLKERIATEPGYALGLLVDAGICNDDGTLTEQFGGGAKEDARQSASQRRQASAIIPPPAQGG